MRTTIAGLCLALLAGCGSSSPTNPAQITFDGTYNLSSINGGKLPYVLVQQGQTSIVITADHLTIADGGTWSEIGSYQSITNGQATSQTGGDAGTWTRSGNSLALFSTQSNTTSYSGTFSTNRLDLSDQGSTFVFLR